MKKKVLAIISLLAGIGSVLSTSFAGYLVTGGTHSASVTLSSVSVGSVFLYAPIDFVKASSTLPSVEGFEWYRASSSSAALLADPSITLNLRLDRAAYATYESGNKKDDSKLTFALSVSCSDSTFLTDLNSSSNDYRIAYSDEDGHSQYIYPLDSLVSVSVASSTLTLSVSYYLTTRTNLSQNDVSYFLSVLNDTEGVVPFTFSFDFGGVDDYSLASAAFDAMSLSLEVSAI
jgi:hypothetical protein